MAQITLPPGFQLVGEPQPTSGALPAGFQIVNTPEAPAELPADPSSGALPVAAAVADHIPAAVRAVAGFAANHPAATQKVIGAGVSTVAGGLGGAVGGVPGAVVGASIRGVTPAQATIRQVAGQLSGETPAVAETAARALGIQNYARELSGLKIKPTDIIPKPNAANAIEGYANSLEKGILRLYGPNGEVVSGPSAVRELATRATPGVVAKTGSRILGALPWIQAATAPGSLADTKGSVFQRLGVNGEPALDNNPIGSSPDDASVLAAANISQAKHGLPPVSSAGTHNALFHALLAALAKAQ